MTYSAEVLADAPLAYYRLGEPSGTTAVDSSGHGRNGTYNNGSFEKEPVHSTGLVGDSNTGYYSAAGTDLVTVPYGAWVDTGQVTLEAWVSDLNTATVSMILDRDNEGSGRCFQFRIYNRKLEYIFWLTTGGPYFCTGSTTLANDTTYHVAATYDGTSARVYVNGVQDAVTTQPGSLVGSTDNLWVGGHGGGPAFLGTLDEVAYYDHALSPDRLTAHHAAAVYTPPPPPANEPPVAIFTTTINGLTVNVDAMGSTDEGGLTYLFDFGDDDGISQNVIKSYTYAEAGTYTITLIVTDGQGLSDTTTRTVTVTGPGGGGGGDDGGGGEEPPPATSGDAWPGQLVTLDDDFTFTADPMASAGLTTETGEPGGTRTAWWFWQAPEDPQALELNLFDDNPSQALLSVYTGTRVDALTLVAQSATGGDPGAVLTAPASGVIYYIQASLPVGAADGDYQLFIGPPADDETYEMDLEVLSGPLRVAPTAVVVTVDGGLAGDDVEFQVDGVLTGDEFTLDDSGSLDATSVDVAEGYLKGDHIVSVHSKTTSLAGEAVFTLERGPYVDLQAVGRDALAVEIPEANTSTGVRRWVLQDLMAGGLGSWVMPRNPMSMSAPEFQRTLTQVHTTAVDEGQYHLASVAHAAIDWTFAGYLDSQLEQQKLQAYGDLNRRFYVLDHRARAWIVAFRSVEIVPRKRQLKDDGNFNDWAADYTVSALIYDQDWRAPT